MSRRKNHIQKHAACHALLPLGALAAGFGLAGAALAQTAVPPAPTSPAVENALPIVRGTASTDREGRADYQAIETRIGKGKQELRDIPQSITVVTERLIDDRNLDTLKDALKNTAGISFQAAEGGEEDIRLRGFSLASTGDIFVDGQRDPAIYERDTFADDRLEVLRGSASMLFGRGSTGGVVNQVRKQPLLIERNEISLTAGSGEYLRVLGDFNQRTGEDAALRIAVMQTSGDAGGLKTDKKGIAPSLRWGIGRADEFLISLYHLDNNNGIYYGLPWLTKSATDDTRTLWPSAPDNYYGAASDRSAGGVSSAGFSHTHRFVDGDELKTQLRLAHYERDLRASAIRFQPAALQPGGQAVTAETFGPSTVLRRGTNNKVQDMDTRYIQSDYSGRAAWFGFKHELASGVDLGEEKFRNYAMDTPTGLDLSKPDTTVGTPNDGGGVNEEARLGSVNRSFKAQALGLYVQDLVQLAPEWKLLGGLRGDRFEGHYDAAQMTGRGGVIIPAAQRSRSDSLWSKRLGVLYQPSATASYHFSWGTSFNTSGDTYQYDAAGSNTPPEASRNIELGGKLDFADGRVSTRFAIFHTNKYNERNRDADSVNDTNYVLSGARHAAGLELDVAGRITPDWEVFASYAWIPSAAIDKGTSLQGETVGTRPGLTPRHSGTVWSTYRVSPSWRLGAGLNMRSSDTPQLAPTTLVPGFLTADLMAEYTLEQLTFKLNLSNIADKHYADMLYRGHYIPGKGRDVKLTASYQF